MEYYLLRTLLLHVLSFCVVASNTRVQDVSTGAIHYFMGQPQEFFTSVLVARRFGKRKFNLEPTTEGFLLVEATNQSPAACKLCAL